MEPTQLDTATQTLYADTWYDMHVVAEGIDVTVSLGPKGGMMGSLFSASTRLTTGATFDIRAEQAGGYKFDDVSLTTTGGGFATSTTLAYNNGNELTSMTTGGVTTNFTYDAWGRQTQKTQGSYSATYAYEYGGKLRSVTSNFPNEGTVTYQYGGDGKRRERTAGGATTRYNWVGPSLLNETDTTGALTMSYVGRFADIPGSNPNSAAYRYYAKDNIRSTRGLFDQSKAQIGAYDYTPYGGILSETGTTITHKFTGHDWDPAAQMYFARYRYYSPAQARWTGRDPLGMGDGVNMYLYVRCAPISRLDPLGLWGWWDDFLGSLEYLPWALNPWNENGGGSGWTASLSLNYIQGRWDPDGAFYLCWGLTTGLVGVSGDYYPGGDPGNVELSVGMGRYGGWARLDLAREPLTWEVA